MIQRHSPPKHRHDGNSPLPLGMDWSPAPFKLNGRETAWPHDPGTGWSYCVMIPSWVVRPKTRDSDPVVFYRVIVGLQSPEGITSVRGVLRRFNDFLKLFSALKKAFSQKSLPTAPSKGLLRLKSRALLEERRRSLVEWMTKLLSDIDISRSVIIASFLELEAAARSSFQVENLDPSEASSSSKNQNTSIQGNTDLDLYVAQSTPVASDYGSDVACETSDIGSPSFGMDKNSEVGTEDLSLDEDFTSPVEKLVKYGVSNIDEGLCMGQAILEQLEGFPSHKVLTRGRINFESNKDHEKSSKTASLLRNTLDLFSEPGNGHHSRERSVESDISDRSSRRGGWLTNSALTDLFEKGLDLSSHSEFPQTIESLGNKEIKLPNDGHLALPLDQRQILNSIIMTMQRRLVSAKTDMEDLISRLNQEIALKDYLATKVKDFEVELETVKQKSKENLEQAILIERERFTQMQWDMEELRQKSIEMESKLKAQQDGEQRLGPKEVSINQEKEMLQRELDDSRLHHENLLKRHQELEVKSKADIKVLVKEVKSLRSYHAELKQQLKQSLEEKLEIESHFQLERHSNMQSKAARRKLLQDCGILRRQLHDCNSSLITESNNNFVINLPLFSDALDLMARSDKQIDHILIEARRLALDDSYTASNVEEDIDSTEEGTETIDEELRKMLSYLLIDGATLRKQVNALIRHASKIDASCGDDCQDHKMENSQNNDLGR